ncbi:MAG: hypothetical protein ACLSA6_13790 [Holdemania massiliensis]
MTRVFVDSRHIRLAFRSAIFFAADGQVLTDLPSDEVADLVRGEAGTEVELEVLRNNEPVTMKIIRGEVNNTVYGEMLDDTLGYLEIILRIDDRHGMRTLFKDDERAGIAAFDSGSAR